MGEGQLNCIVAITNIITNNAGGGKVATPD